MKLTRRQLRRLINEAFDPVRVKTVKPEDYNPPYGLRSVSLGKPREFETPFKKVGNFFATRVPYKPPRGYSSLSKRKYFYMILPDGEAINIDHRDIRINNQKLVNTYLNMLNDHPLTQQILISFHFALFFVILSLFYVSKYS